MASPAGIPACAIKQVVIVRRYHQRPANCSQANRLRGNFLRLSLKGAANCVQQTLAAIAILNFRAGALSPDIQQFLTFANGWVLDAGPFLQVPSELLP